GRLFDEPDKIAALPAPEVAEMVDLGSGDPRQLAELDLLAANKDAGQAVAVLEAGLEEQLDVFEGAVAPEIDVLREAAHGSGADKPVAGSPLPGLGVAVPAGKVLAVEERFETVDGLALGRCGGSDFQVAEAEFCVVGR